MIFIQPAQVESLMEALHRGQPVTGKPFEPDELGILLTQAEDEMPLNRAQPIHATVPGCNLNIEPDGKTTIVKEDY